MNKVKTRKSNFELLRIFSMILIVMWHFIYYGNLWKGSIGNSHHMWNLVIALIYIHVNLFVLLTGYFGCTNKFKLSKLLKINNSIWVYVSAFTLIAIFIFNQKIVPLNMIKAFLPISFNDYWFLTCYIILYLISPMLNIIVHNVSHKKFKLILFLYFISLVLLPYLTNNEFYNVNSGYSIINFVFLYLLGAYFRLYPIKEWKIFKKFSLKKLKITLIVCYFVLGILNFLVYEFGLKLGSINSVTINYVGTVLDNGFLAYNNIFIVLEAILVFNYFSLIEFKNKYINNISKYVLGVYLITENVYMRPFLYKTLNFKSFKFFEALPKLIMYVLIVFVVCIIIEALRQFIFNLCSKTKLAKFLRNSVINKLKKHGLESNW